MTRLVRVGLIATALPPAPAACGGGSTESAAPATPAPTVSPVDPATAGHVTGRIVIRGRPSEAHRRAHGLGPELRAAGRDHH